MSGSEKMKCAPGANLTRSASQEGQMHLPFIASEMPDYPYSTRGRIVTMPGQSVSNNTKPTMIIRYGIVTRAM